MAPLIFHSQALIIPTSSPLRWGCLRMNQHIRNPSESRYQLRQCTVGQAHFHPNVANLQILVGFHVVNAHGFWNRPFPNKKHISGYTTHPWHKNHILLYSVYWAFPLVVFSSTCSENATTQFVTLKIKGKNMDLS